MSVQLFPHNEAAYRSVCALLDECGKAAVIHPTGTGKSFIAFRLCADHPDKRVCWLSPSEYIYQTQAENWTDAGGTVPQNISFFTYAKLMLMTDDALSDLQPDYIIQDEFHRIGAERWGEGVQRLMDHSPSAKLLGLSATNIRYLDNQRDMAMELYNGNVASEMTLGDAIVRGILKAPTYVLSVFAYQQDFLRLQTRAERAKSGAVRDKAARYLEALRRALEQADGLDVIFDKHMTDRAGKYLIFCSNQEHMSEMISRVPEWFHKIDRRPHVYSACSEDRASGQAIADFKADRSDHLKLLFCIDMLNEGIHVADVNGVILFRPTVSPIIYKQQIGRALSACGTKEPIIFDIVNNIDNLYSIDTLQQEMEAAVSYYHFLGEGGMVVQERFRLIDEVREARELFERLNDTLTASWDLMYRHAEAYYHAHGDLNVPRRYRTEEGYNLGLWLMAQRRVYAGEQYGNLSEERIARLNAIGMRWGSHSDAAWERYYAAAKAYYAAHGDLKVPVTEVTRDGLRLGTWVANLRSYRKSGIRTAYLTEERIRALDDIGMVWDVPDYIWEEYYASALAYYRANGHLDVPSDEITPGGLRLGSWIAKLRKLRKARGSGLGAELTQEQIARLDQIGMIWETKWERAWLQGYEAAAEFFQQNGHLDIPNTYATPSGFRLGRWLNSKRERCTPEQRVLLDAIGMVWERPDPWETRYALAKAYYEANGNLNMPGDYRVNGIWLAKWLNEQRHVRLGSRRGKALTEDQIRRLDAIGMAWEDRRDQLRSDAWHESYLDAKRYYEAKEF